MPWTPDKRERERIKLEILKRAMNGEKFSEIGKDYHLTAEEIAVEIRLMMEAGYLMNAVDDI